MNVRRWGISLFFCLSVFLALAAFKIAEIKAAIAFGESFPEHSESVELTFAQPVQYRESMQVPGTVVAPQRVNVQNELPGQIVSVNFTSGMPVDKGQVLIQQDVSIERANLASRKAHAALARSVYQRTLDLRQSNAVSKEQLEKAKAELVALDADVAALNSQIDKKTITAPFTGIASLHQFEAGQFLPAQTAITTLIGDDDYVWIDFSIPQFYAELAYGTSLSVRAIGQGASEEPVILPDAIIIARDSVISKATRSRHYRAKLQSRLVPPDALVDLDVPVAQPETLLGIDVTAVQRDLLGQYVYILEADPDIPDAYRAKRRQVTVKAVDQQQAMISEGLEKGDRIAGPGAFKLHPGILVIARQRQPLANAPRAIQSDTTRPSGVL